MDKMTGKVWVLGDDIDTDIIIPTESVSYTHLQKPGQTADS